MASDVKANLAQLVALQEKDAAIDKLRFQVQAIPVQVKEQNDLIAQARTDTEGKKKELTQFQLQKKAKEMELASREEQIRKHTAELNSIKSNDAYRALLVEIESSKQDKSALESEILELMEKIENASAQAKKDDADFKTRENEIKAGIAKLEGEMKTLQDEIGRLEAERNEFAKQIPNDVVQAYERIRAGREGIAIVPVEGYMCSGCRMEIRPSLLNEVFKGHEIVVCDSCSRILYKK